MIENDNISTQTCKLMAKWSGYRLITITIHHNLLDCPLVIRMPNCTLTMLSEDRKTWSGLMLRSRSWEPLWSRQSGCKILPSQLQTFLHYFLNRVYTQIHKNTSRTLWLYFLPFQKLDVLFSNPLCQSFIKCMSSCNLYFSRWLKCLNWVDSRASIEVHKWLLDLRYHVNNYPVFSVIFCCWK